MKSFFSRLGGRKDRRKENASSIDPAEAPTPQRGLLDRNLSTSSAVSTHIPFDIGKKSPSKSGMSKIGGKVEAKNKDMQNARRSIEELKSTNVNPDSAKTKRGKKKDGTRKSEPLKVRPRSEKQTDVKGTPGSPGSVTVGRRSAMSIYSGAKVGGAKGKEPEQIDLDQPETSMNTPSASSPPNEEYYVSLQQAMASSMMDSADRQQKPSPLKSVPPSFLPDTPSEAPDLEVARAMVESQFAIRQAEELKKARDNLFAAAVSKAMEESISSADYDHLLRDMKMWMIDLDATSDDVVSEISMVRKREQEIPGKIERALQKGDTRRLSRLLWEQENLPEVKNRIESLQEMMVPVGIASSDLMTLRKKILNTYPPIEESQRARDDIIETLFNSLKRAQLKSSGDLQTADDCQDSSDLRCLVVALLEDAKKITRAPEAIIKEAKVMVRETFKENQGSVDIGEIEALGNVDQESNEAPSECRTEANSTETETQVLIKKTALDSALARDTSIRSSSNEAELERLKKKEKQQMKKGKSNEPRQRESRISSTKVKPFNLSKSRSKVERTKYRQEKGPPIKRVPAFFSLTHELLTDKGIVSQAVDWKSKEYSIESFSSKYHTIPAPVNVDEFYSEDIHELLSYVKKHASSYGEQLKSANIPNSSRNEDKWYTMVEVAGAVEGLLWACEKFLTWKAPMDSDSISSSCHELKHLVNQTLSVIADTAYAHDTLRVAIKKHHLPWDENIISQVRWDAQHAASMIMQAAIDCAEDQERKRGIKRSATQKNVLKPLGQAVIATFAVHQLSGGFGGEAALVCDQLVELCVHCARQLDPKWFRGTKVVRS
jgi:hypothetical protein